MEHEIRPAVTVVVRPYASSLPLGTFAFGVGNVLYSVLTLHWIPSSEAAVVGLMLLAFVAPLELIPCAIAFVSRDTGAATAMGIFSAAWVVLGVQLLQPGWEKPSPATGVFLLLLALCLIILAAVTFTGKPLIGVLLTVAILRSICAALVQLHRPQLNGAAGWLGLLLALFAFFTGLGLLFEDVRLKPFPMTFRRGEAKAAMEGDLDYQVSRIAREAGGRQQL